MSSHLSVDRRNPPDLDSTQTVRTISQTELYDSHQSKWYAIQVAVSDRPVNLELMPRLDVFVVHRLYVVADKQGDATRYGLRLGFFPDEVSAEVICGYLRTFFSSPSIVRVSTAEQARFAQPAAPRVVEQNPASSSAPAARPRDAAAADSAPAPAPAVPRQTVAQESVAANTRAKALPPPIKANSSQKLVKRTKTLGEELLEVAREVQSSRSGKHRVSEQRSWLARLFGGPRN
jgi:hypothetical protein